jgi:hypothetical protein
LVTEYWTKMKSIRSVKPVSTKSAFFIWPEMKTFSNTDYEYKPSNCAGASEAHIYI